MSAHHSDSHSTEVAHDIPHDAAHIKKHLGLYWGVFAALAVGTALTVGLSYFNFGSDKANIVVAMILATFKAALVAAIFMHLKEEKVTIYRFLIMTVIFAIGLFGLTLLAFTDHIHL